MWILLCDVSKFLLPLISVINYITIEVQNTVKLLNE